MILLYTVIILIHSYIKMLYSRVNCRRVNCRGVNFWFIKNIFIKNFHLRILENNANQIEMRPKSDRSNVSNFFLIIGQLRYHFPKTTENSILGKLLREAKGSES